jgi:hypothetical protein
MHMDDQVRYYKSKLQYEIDPWDLNEALERGDKILLVDTRTPEAYGRNVARRRNAHRSMWDIDSIRWRKT